MSELKTVHCRFNGRELRISPTAKWWLDTIGPAIAKATVPDPAVGLAAFVPLDAILIRTDLELPCDVPMETEDAWTLSEWKYFLIAMTPIGRST